MKLPADRVNRLRGFYETRRVLVTGGAGFIGGHLCDALLSLGASITVIDDLSNSSLDHLAGLIEIEPERIRFVQGSILDDGAMNEACEGVDTAFHLAAIGSVPRSIEQPQRVWSVNTTGVVRTLEAARIAGVQRVVFSSSSSVYGDDPKLPRVETTIPVPQSPYAASKLAGEAALSAWARSYNLSTVSVRFFNIFGPRQSADSAYAAVIAAFAKKLLAGEAPTIFGDGEHSRDFTSVDNAVLAVLLAGACRAELKGEAINVGTGKPITINQLAQRMIELAGAVGVTAQHGPERAGDVKHSNADINRARDILGYEPVADFETALRETFQWYRSAVARA